MFTVVLRLGLPVAEGKMRVIGIIVLRSTSGTAISPRVKLVFLLYAIHMQPVLKAFTSRVKSVQLGGNSVQLQGNGLEKLFKIAG